MRRLALALTLCGTACVGGYGVRGNGHRVREQRTLPAFSGVEVHGGIHAIVETGPQSVEVETDDNLMALLETKVDDGHLEIGFASFSHVWSTEVTVRISIPAVSYLHASGGSEIRAQLSPAEALEIGASGGAVVRASGIQVTTLSASGSGGARLQLAGSADDVKLSMSGGTRIKAGKLEARLVRVSGSGGCTAEVNALESVRGSISGGCDVHLSGRAQSRVKTSGGSSVDYEDD
jgi:hypothetical protein